VRRAHQLADVCERHGVSLPAAALAFPLLHPAVTSVCVGARSPDQVARNVALAGAEIPLALWDDLRGRGLVRTT
jgi:D-threo-aldose 1-dehydrogenase